MKKQIAAIAIKRIDAAGRIFAEALPEGKTKAREIELVALPLTVHVLTEQQQSDSDGAGLVMGVFSTEAGAEAAKQARRNELRAQARGLGRRVVFYREGTEDIWTHDHHIEQQELQP